MSAHSPAPWRLSADHGRIAAVDDADGNPVCHAMSVLGEKHAETRDANARLIAAAPELLAELQHLVACLHPWIENGGQGIPGLATVNKARALVAKAATP